MLSAPRTVGGEKCVYSPSTVMEAHAQGRFGKTNVVSQTVNSKVNGLSEMASSLGNGVSLGKKQC